MDTSETYILMCEQAEEIQALQERGHGARCNVGKIGHGLNGAVYFFPEEPSWREEQYRDWDKAPLSIWLPRQDELQEMIDPNNYSHGDMIEILVDWATWIINESDNNWKQFREYETGEQLWLAFVMRECYHKIWGGEKWIKIE